MKELDFNTENSVKVVKAMGRALWKSMHWMYFALKSLVNSLTD